MSSVSRPKPMQALTSPLHITGATYVTLLRPILLAIAILCGFIGYRNDAVWVELGFALGLLAALTDLADGKLSRWLNCQSDLGAALDTMMDKCWHVIIFSACVVPIAKHNHIHAKILVFYIAIAIVRDMYVTCLKQLAIKRAVSVEPKWFGKWRTVAFMILGGYLYLYAFESQLLGSPDWMSALKLSVCYGGEALVTAITVITGIAYHRHYSKAFVEKVQL